MDHATIAVVGAGVLGCLVAREILDRHPGAAVLMLDRDAVASGASRRSAGLHFPRGATARARRMSVYSQDFYDRLRADRPDLPITPVRMSLVSAAGEDELREIYTESAHLTSAHGVSCAVRVRSGMSVWEVAGAHYTDVEQLTQRLVAGLRGRLSVREGVRVTGLEPSAEGVLLGLGTGDTVAVDKVVLAPGPWLADPAWAGLVAPLGARVKKVAALHLERRPTAEDAVVVFHDEDAFLQPLVHRGHWLFSYTCQVWDVDPDTVGSDLSASRLVEAHDCLRGYAPDLAEDCTSGRVFCDAYSPSREPLVKALDPDGRVVFAGAANGSGYRLAPAVAAETVDLLTDPTASGRFQ